MLKKTWPVVLLLLTLLSIHPHQILAQDRPGNPPSVTVTPELTRSLIDSIGDALHKYYIFPDTAYKMTAYLKAEYKKGSYKEIKDPRQLAGRLREDLQKAHHDGHLHIDYDPGFARRLSDTTGEAQRRKEDYAHELTDMKANNFFFKKVEILAGNIGYIGFNGFTGMIAEARPTFTSAFRFVANTKALIIDMRQNGGGSPNMVQQVESYFFKEKTHMNDIVDRLAGRKNEGWADPADAEGVTLQMPIYILTSKNTFSGAEDFSYSMQAVKRAIIIGDTTGGGAHPTRPFNVGLGFVAGIPFARSLNPYTNTDWEGTGVIPDLPVTSEKAMATAVEVIFTKQLEEAKTDREKAGIQWQLNDALSILSEKHLDPLTLSTYVGTFQGGLVFYVGGNELYCRNAERGNAVFKLRYISGDLFVLDENVEVEFIRDASGKLTSLIMHWSNGRESEKSLVQ